MWMQGGIEDQDLADVVGLDDASVAGAQALVGGLDVLEFVGGMFGAIDRVQAFHAGGATR